LIQDSTEGKCLLLAESESSAKGPAKVLEIVPSAVLHAIIHQVCGGTYQFPSIYFFGFQIGHGFFNGFAPESCSRTGRQAAHGNQ
jgi:hypothetical protein